MNEPTFIPTCQNYDFIIYSHSCTAQPDKDCGFFLHEWSTYSWNTTNTSNVGIYALTITGYFNDDDSFNASTDLTLTVSDSCITIAVPTIENQFYYPLNNTGAPTNLVFPPFTLVSSEPGCLFSSFTHSFSC